MLAFPSSITADTQPRTGGVVPESTAQQTFEFTVGPTDYITGDIDDKVNHGSTHNSTCAAYYIACLVCLSFRFALIETQ